MKLSSLARYMRLRPFDVSTEQGRSDERYRLALWSVVANLLSQCITMLVMVFSVSWTLPYLGAERFGVWMTIASFVGMLVFLDLGTGNALTNQVAKAATQEKRLDVTNAISGGLGLLFLLGILAGSLLAVVIATLPWASIIKVRNPAIGDEIQLSLFLFAFLFGINLFSTGVHRVFAGLQRSFEAHVATALGSVVSLAALWWAARNEAGIPALVLATLGCQSISGFLLLILLKSRGLFRLHGIHAAVRTERNSLLRVGGLFFVLQIGTMVGWGADSLIIASTLGAAQVAIYSVTQRLFQFVVQPLSMVNAPLWSAYADAHARGDKEFIFKTLKRSLILTASLTALGGGILFALSPQLIEWWTKGTISVPLLFVLTYFVWIFCETLGNALAMMMNGCGIVREQVFTVLMLTILDLPIKLISLNYFGIVGMLATYIVLYCEDVLPLYGFYFRNSLIRRIGKNERNL